jgi:hypothetical protein
LVEYNTDFEEKRVYLLGVSKEAFLLARELDVFL